MRGNNIPISGTHCLGELANLLKHLIATLSRHQTDGLEDGKRGTSRLPIYTFLHLKIHNKESGLQSEKSCQQLINKALTDKQLTEYHVSAFSQPPSLS